MTSIEQYAKHDVITISEEASLEEALLEEAAKLMRKKKRRRFSNC